jgi:hypothetical protein
MKNNGKTTAPATMSLFLLPLLGGLNSMQKLKQKQQLMSDYRVIHFYPLHYTSTYSMQH